MFASLEVNGSRRDDLRGAGGCWRSFTFSHPTKLTWRSLENHHFEYEMSHLQMGWLSIVMLLFAGVLFHFLVRLLAYYPKIKYISLEIFFTT